MTLRPPLTPPYLLIIFTVTSTLLFLVSFGKDIFQEENQQAFFDAIATIIPAVFTWVAGALPLKAYRPSFNVAGAKDVRLFPPQYMLANIAYIWRCKDTFGQTILPRR